MTLRVVTFHWGSWGDGQAERYIGCLRDGVARHLRQPHEFSLITDDLGLPGELNKLQVFDPGRFPAGDRILALDLDTVVCGPLDDVAGYNGPFCVLEDFYAPGKAGGGVVSFEAGSKVARRIWALVQDGDIPEDGDERRVYREHVPEADFWQRVLPGRIVTAKPRTALGPAPVRPVIPFDASVICFHGRPRPHEVPAGSIPWLDYHWRTDEEPPVNRTPPRSAASSLTTGVDRRYLNAVKRQNRDREERELRAASIARKAARRPAKPPPLTIRDGGWSGRPVVLVGGGPSAVTGLARIRELIQARGAEVVALNRSSSLFPKATVHLGVDRRYWTVARTGEFGFDPALFSGVKLFTNDGHPAGIPWLSEVPALKEWSGSLRSGLQAQHTGVAALNLAYVMGASSIYLAGFDYLPVTGSDRQVWWHSGYPSPQQPSSVYDDFLDQLRAIPVDLNCRLLTGPSAIDWWPGIDRGEED